MAHDVFISFSTADKLTADAVCHGLEAAGIRCWISSRDIPPGMDFGEAITLGIEGCRIMVLIFSAQANASKYVIKEVTLAVGEELTIIPFRIENVPASGALKYHLSNPNWLDALDEPLAAHIQELRASITRLLPAAPTPPPFSPPAPVEPVVAIPVQLNLEWVTIPGGDFLYGEDNARKYLPIYQVMKYPVTVAQYRQFCTATGCEMPDAPSWGWQDTHPVVNVTWEDAAAFAAYAGGALPTEEEWEKAARGTDGRVYPWGNDWDAANAHCSQMYYGEAKQTAPVGSYPVGVSPYKCLDLAGNVCEWCDSRYYSDKKDTRVLRGGSWANIYPGNFSTTNRYPGDSTFRFRNNGFRCVLRTPGP